MTPGTPSSTTDKPSTTGMVIQLGTEDGSQGTANVPSTSLGTVSVPTQGTAAVPQDIPGTELAGSQDLTSPTPEDTQTVSISQPLVDNILI